MNREEFDQFVEQTTEQIKSSLITKGKEYDRNDNPFHNFDKGEQKSGRIRERVIESYSLKHEVSIDDMISDIENGKLPDYMTVEEKFGDAINYLILKKASIYDKINKKLPF
jgi:hypothetical protein